MNPLAIVVNARCLNSESTTNCPRINNFELLITGNVALIWAVFLSSLGTWVLFGERTPDLRPGLLHAAPSGLRTGRGAGVRFRFQAGSTAGAKARINFLDLLSRP